MAYTYLITGATSDVGRALIERLLADAPADTTVLAQGCGDLRGKAAISKWFRSRARVQNFPLCCRQNRTRRTAISGCLYNIFKAVYHKKKI